MRPRSSCADPSCRAYAPHIITVRHRRLAGCAGTWRMCGPHALAELRRHAGGAWAVEASTVLAG